MSNSNLKYSKATIVEITTEYIGVLMDGKKLMNIGIDITSTEDSIKEDIVNHAISETGVNVIPFSKIEDIPKEITEKLNISMDLSQLEQEVLLKKEKLQSQEFVDCTEARLEMLPKYIEFIQAIYEKEVLGDNNKYNEVLNRITITNEIFPKELGDLIPIAKYEEIINGL